MLSLNNRKMIMLIVLISIVTIAFTIFIVTDKPDIHEATIEELQEIDGIGAILSWRIVRYLKVNEGATIDDLDHVLGIGEIKLELIRKEYD